MPRLTIYESRGEHELFVERTLQDLHWSESGTASCEIELIENETYQEIDGFGASFTDSSAYLVHQVLDREQREEVMHKLFHPEEGIGLSVLRNPMGASDYARTVYSYNDMPEHKIDPELEHFSIAHDEEDIIPLLKQAVALNPQVKLFASPWSAPGWMKTSGTMIGGELRPEYYSAYAQYFVKYIQAYKGHELPIYAVTPQNEPLYEPMHYPSMLMTAEPQAKFIKDHLKPAFVKHGISTKILSYDHNWDRPDYPLMVLELAGDAIDGVAWHWYGGEPSAQTKVYREFEDKEVHFTEGSGGEWIPPFEQAFSNVMRTGIRILENYSKSFILWNMALDEMNGPTVPGFGRSTCRGIITVNQHTHELTYTLDYYALAHFSRVIRPRALRIKSESNREHILVTAFYNKDKSVAAVLFNDGDAPENVVLKLNGAVELNFRLEAKTALSVRIGREVL